MKKKKITKYITPVTVCHYQFHKLKPQMLCEIGALTAKYTVGAVAHRAPPGALLTPLLTITPLVEQTGVLLLEVY